MKTLLKTSQLNEYLKPDTKIIYRRGDYEIAYDHGDLQSRKDIPSDDLSLEKICYISDKRSMIPDFLENKIERKNANYHLQDTLENFLVAADVIKQLPLEYLNVEFKIEKGSKGDKYIIKGTNGNNCNILLRNASSGTQTVTPLSLIVEYFATKFDAQKSMNSSLFSYLQDNDRLKDFSTAKNIGEIKSKNVHLFIEEPELSLYPNSQCALIDFLVSRCFMTQHPYNMSLMMATHSPYIVNYLNVLVSRNAYSDLPYLNMKDVNIYEVCDGCAGPLKLTDKPLFDTRSMSDPIIDMYSEINRA